jgi:hypothetical protein
VENLGGAERPEKRRRKSCDPGSAPRDMTAVWAGSHAASLRQLPSPRRIAASAPRAVRHET